MVWKKIAAALFLPWTSPTKVMVDHIEATEREDDAVEPQ